MESLLQISLSFFSSLPHVVNSDTMASQNVTLGPDAQSITLSGGSWTTNGNGTSWLSTKDKNASVTFTFDGSFISIAGSLSSSSSKKTPKLLYFLDGNPDSSFVYQSGGSLYTSSPLKQGSHNMTMTLASNASLLSIQNVTLTVSNPQMTVQEPEVAPSSSKTSATVIIGSVVGALVFVVLLIAGLFLILHRRKFRRRSTYQGPLQANLPTSKEAFTSKHYSLHGITFTHSPTVSVDSLASLPRSKRKSSRMSYGISSTDIPHTDMSIVSLNDP